MANREGESHIRDNEAVENERRRANFSEDEIRVLVQLVSDHYHSLYGRNVSTTSKREKGRIWDAILEQVNEVGGAMRTRECLKNKYRDLKLAVRRKLSEAAGAGGRRPLTEVEREIARFIPRDTIRGFREFARTVPGTMAAEEAVNTTEGPQDEQIFPPVPPVSPSSSSSSVQNSEQVPQEGDQFVTLDLFPVEGENEEEPVPEAPGESPFDQMPPDSPLERGRARGRQRGHNSFQPSWRDHLRFMYNLERQRSERYENQLAEHRRHNEQHNEIMIAIGVFIERIDGHMARSEESMRSIQGSMQSIGADMRVIRTVLARGHRIGARNVHSQNAPTHVRIYRGLGTRSQVNRASRSQGGRARGQRGRASCSET